jgi:hypothetical protein
LALLQGDLVIGEEFNRAIPVAVSLSVVVAYIVGFSAASIHIFKGRDM